MMLNPNVGDGSEASTIIAQRGVYNYGTVVTWDDAAVLSAITIDLFSK